MKKLLLASLLAPAAFAQFALYQVEGNVERPVAAVFDLGTVYPSETIAARFRIRNTSTAPAALPLLAVRGTGFQLTGAPPIPAGLAAQEAIDFSVTFQAPAAGSYSAALDSEGIAVILTAKVLVSLTAQAGGAALGAGGLSFPTTETGAAASLRVTIVNLTGLALPLPPISANGEAFAIRQTPAAGTVLQPLDAVAFDVVFRPPGAGPWTGTLAIGDRSYPLAGTAIGPTLPRPRLAVDLAEALSGRQGSIAVTLDAVSKAAGAGTLTLDFQPAAKGATDPAIQLGVVGRSLAFTVAPGDTRVRFGELDAVAFQTGTTAGTITISAELGGVVDRQSVTIAPAAVVIQSATAARVNGSIELRLAGFDNARTAGLVVFTFYDSTGVAYPAIPVDYSADFASFFASSDAGGQFLLRSVFPVSGDATKITAFEVEIRNSAGISNTGRVKF